MATKETTDQGNKKGNQIRGRWNRYGGGAGKKEGRSVVELEASIHFYDLETVVFPCKPLFRRFKRHCMPTPYYAYAQDLALVL